MNKKLLALAVAAALPMSAQAGVTVYGKIHASIDFISPDSVRVYPLCVQPLHDEPGDHPVVCPSVKINFEDVQNVESRASRIGFKGSEDLGDGLKLIWKVESQVDIANSLNTSGTYWKGRNAYIGLAGGWGTFLYGRHDTPLKMSTGRLDLFSDELADYNATAGFIDRRSDQTIAYISPSWSGLTLAGAIIPDGDFDGGGDFAGGWSIAAMWTLNSIYLSAAYEDITDLRDDYTQDKFDNKIWRIGAGWDIGNFWIGGVYENEDADLKNDLDKYQISGSYTFGNNKIKAMWADHDFDNSSIRGFIDDEIDDGDSWAIGWDYNMSKRSKMYVQYADSDRMLMNRKSTATIDGHTVKLAADGLSLGMVHNF